MNAYLFANKLQATLGGRRIFSGVSCALSRGTLVALVGPNGAGKTTLLRAVAGLIRSEGELRIGGRDAASVPIGERARLFAYLPQGHAAHWPLAVRDIVALGRYPHGATDPSRLRTRDADAVERAMHATGTMPFAERPVTELSSGERSRVAIARVLAVEAPVILADEPTASLDPHYQIEAMGLLRKAADEGSLVIVVTHDLGLAARFADFALVLNAGTLVASAVPREAFASSILAEVFRIKAFRDEHSGAPVIVPWSTS